MPESTQTQGPRCTAFACCFGRKTRKEPSERARTTTGPTGRRLAERQRLEKFDLPIQKDPLGTPSLAVV